MTSVSIRTRFANEFRRAGRRFTRDPQVLRVVDDDPIPELFVGRIVDASGKRLPNIAEADCAFVGELERWRGKTRAAHTARLEITRSDLAVCLADTMLIVEVVKSKAAESC